MTAWIALLIWPVLAGVFYRVWPLPVALAATLVGGYLLLPTHTEFDLPVIPPLDKHTIPALSALVLTWIACLDGRQDMRVLPGWLPRNRLIQLFLGLLVAGAFATAATNGDTYFIGPLTFSGLSLYDGFAIALGIVMLLLPFILARKVLAMPEGQTAAVYVLIAAAVPYAFLALWEVRMSPQLNNQIYGFFPHAWNQHIRGDGFRPIVFLEHGLWLGIFLSVAAIASAGMIRAAPSQLRPVFVCTTLFLVGTLVLSKVLGALLITIILLPVCLLLPLRLQLMVSAAVAVLVLSYPVSRNTDFVPTDQVLELAEAVNPDRARSLRYRLGNEDILLERARERPLFGWGGWGRNQVFDSDGDEVSTTDGRWVILFGQGGWIRYIGEFGLLSWGIIALFLRRRSVLDPISGVLALALAANLIDLLPNAGMSPVTWMLAGALAGRLEYRGANAPAKASATVQNPARIRYSRDLSDSAGEAVARESPYRRTHGTASMSRRSGRS